MPASDPLPLTHTSIHAAFGESGSLDFAMVERAIAAQVPEGETLDWKRDYAPGEPGSQDFAKDVALFANARGGVIVLGVDEDGGGRASSAHLLDISETAYRRYRQMLGTRLSPALHGARVVPLPDPADASGDVGFLAIVVPASPDAPHMVGTEGRSGFPRRVGRDTHWMREYEIERAYRERFDRDADATVALARATKDVRATLDATNGQWLIATSRLHTPLPAWRGGLTREEARVFFRGNPPDFAPITPPRTSGFYPTSELGAGREYPRPGLRRWRWTTVNASVPDYQQQEGVVIEVHHDGTIVLAVDTDYGPQRDAAPGKQVLSDVLLTGVVADFIDLLAMFDAQRGVDGARTITLEHHSVSGAPLALTAPSRWGDTAPGQVPQSRDLGALQPVQIVVTTLSDRHVRRSVAIDLLSDVVNQFGATLEDLNWPQYPDHAGQTDDQWYTM